jgi:outer membrane protein TolC
VAKNLNVRIAAERVEQARQNVTVARSNGLPGVTAGATYSESHTSGSGATPFPGAGGRTIGVSELSGNVS